MTDERERSGRIRRMQRAARSAATASASVDAVRRRVAFAAVAVTVAAGVIVDRGERHDSVERRPSLPVSPQSASPLSTGSSAWFCPGGPLSRPTRGVDATAQRAVLTLANPGDRAARAQVTFVTDDERSVSRPAFVAVTVPALGSVDVPFTAEGAPSSGSARTRTVGAIVESDVGGLGVEQTLSGTLGPTTASCASAASRSWYTADGVTIKGTSTVLNVLNPFAEDAVVDISLVTDQGPREPARLRGISIPGRSVRAVRLEEVARRRRSIASEVRVRTGRVVVGKMTTYDGAEGVRGVTAALAAPGTDRTWIFGDGRRLRGVEDRYHVFNPSRTSASVSLTLLLESGLSEPNTFVLAPRSTAELDPSSFGDIAPGDRYGLAFTVAAKGAENGPIVVERRSLGRSPALTRGVAATLGATEAGRDWMLAAGRSTTRSEEELSVLNVSATEAMVRVDAIVEGERVTLTDKPLRLAPGAVQQLRLGDTVVADSVVVLASSSQPVVVSRRLRAVAGRAARATVRVPEAAPSLAPFGFGVTPPVSSTTIPTTSIAATTIPTTTIPTTTIPTTTGPVTTSSSATTTRPGPSTTTGGGAVISTVTTAPVTTATTASTATVTTVTTTTAAAVSTTTPRSGAAPSSAGQARREVLGRVVEPGRGFSDSLGVLVTP